MGELSSRWNRYIEVWQLGRLIVDTAGATSKKRGAVNHTGGHFDVRTVSPRIVAFEQCMIRRLASQMDDGSSRTVDPADPRLIGRERPA